MEKTYSEDYFKGYEDGFTKALERLIGAIQEHVGGREQNTPSLADDGLRHF